jgi:DNA-binding CsgD family transcriptional regulator
MTSQIKETNGKADRLTLRQKDCLLLVAEGYTSKEIGRKLGLSPSTVDNHVLAAIKVLDAPSRAAAARELRALILGQKLPSEPQQLVKVEQSISMVPAAAEASWHFSGLSPLSLPPIGGRKNELEWTERTFRIIQVAVLSLSIFLSMTLVIAGAFSAFS